MAFFWPFLFRKDDKMLFCKLLWVGDHDMCKLQMHMALPILTSSCSPDSPEFALILFKHLLVAVCASLRIVYYLAQIPCCPSELTQGPCGAPPLQRGNSMAETGSAEHSIPCKITSCCVEPLEGRSLDCNWPKTIWTRARFNPVRTG
jgi:hypothetical protein